MKSATAGMRGNWPDPRIALALSLVPGLGQLHNRQPGKAAYFLAWTLGSLGAAVLLITQGERVGHDLLERNSGALFLLVALGSVLLFLTLFLRGLYAWGSAAIDAWQSAAAIRSGHPELAEERRRFRL